MTFNSKLFLAKVPHQPGIYQMIGAFGRVIYVGKAKDLKKRLTSYFVSKVKDPKAQSLIEHVKGIEITVTHNENEAVLLECNLIKQHLPRYNILLRDDKSYPYIIITTFHDFPRIDIYRGHRKKKAAYFGPYPSAQAVRETINLLQKTFRLRTCQDHFFATRLRPCLLYQIARCTAPCVELITQADYAHDVESAILFLQGKGHIVIEDLQQRMEKQSAALAYEKAAYHRDQISRLRQIQARQYINVTSGDIDILGAAANAGSICIVLLSIRNGQILGSKSFFPSLPYSGATIAEVIAAFISQHYLGKTAYKDIPKVILTADKIPDQTWLAETLTEQANHKVAILLPSRGEKRKWLLMANINAKQALNLHLHQRLNMNEKFQALQQLFNLPAAPEQIECFDISHNKGEATIGSCVVFNQFGPIKSMYRRFNIKNVIAGDDVAAIQQIILRRFKRLQKEQAKLPDLVFVDGGLTQLSAAQKVMQELGLHQINLVGIAKGAGRKSGYEKIYQLHKAPKHLAADAKELHIIQQIRDEAHRFAITAHRAKSAKKRGQSVLETIPGIGAIRRRELLRYFGGIQGLAHASLEELSRVPHISRSLAERIFAMFHDKTL